MALRRSARRTHRFHPYGTKRVTSAPESTQSSEAADSDCDARPENVSDDSDKSGVEHIDADPSDDDDDDVLPDIKPNRDTTPPFSDASDTQFTPMTSEPEQDDLPSSATASAHPRSPPTPPGSMQVFVKGTTGQTETFLMTT